MLLALILGLISNLDNLILGITYGTAKIKIKFATILIISFVLAITTLVFGIIGESISCLFFPKLANILGGILLVCIGIYYILKDCMCRNCNKNISKDKRVKKSLDGKSMNMNYKNIIALSLSLGVNNIPISLLVAMSDVNILFFSIFTFLASVLFLYIGNNLGIKIKNSFFLYLSNVLLICIGIVQIFNAI